MTTTIVPRRQAALAFIFACTLMDVVSLGIMIPVLPALIKQFTGGDTAAASTWNVLFATTWGLMQFIASPVLGMISDRFGRRPVLLISIFGLGVDYLFMAVAPSLWWLWLGRAFTGVTAASFSTASAYIADITEPQNRAKSFGLIGAAFSLGFLVGPALGGFLGEIDLRLPFFVAAGLALVNWLYGLFVLPESLPPERRAAKFNWARANPLGSLDLLRSHADLTRLAVVGGLFQLAHVVLPTVFVLYTGFRYGWSPAVVGLAMALTGAINIVVQTQLVGRIVRKLGERGALLAGLMASSLGFLLYGLAPFGWTNLMVMPVFAFSALVQPSLQGLMTRRVGPSEQGQLQGANSSIVGITALIGPSLFGLSFAFAVRHDAALHLPGLPLFIAAGLTGLAALWVTRMVKAEPLISAASAP